MAIKPRSLIIFDLSHSGYIGELVVEALLKKIESFKDLELDEPLVLKGKSKEEPIAVNKSRLGETVLIGLIGARTEEFSYHELRTIDEFVSLGGSLLITPDPPFTPPNKVAGLFGFKYIRNSIKDKINHDGKHVDHIMVTDLANHPINQAVETISFGDYGCYPLEIDHPNTLVVAQSSNSATPSQSPVAIILNHGEGEVFAIGQASIFQGKFLEKYDNERWLENIIRYFLSPKSTIEGTKFCSSCGSEVEETDLFCSNCGTPAIR